MSVLQLAFLLMHFRILVPDRGFLALECHRFVGGSSTYYDCAIGLCPEPYNEGLPCLVVEYDTATRKLDAFVPGP